MKKLLALVFIAFISCNKNKIDANPEPAPTEITSDTVVEVDGHNAQNSLDYIGMYSGKIFCKGCDAITATLELNEGFTFILSKGSNDKKTISEEIKGTFLWNDKGNTIILDNLAGEPNKFFVKENALVQLNQDGNQFSDNLADKYVLTKMSEGEASKTDSNPDRIRTQITDKKWLLSDLNENPIKNEAAEFFLLFDTKNSFTAFAGCNRISGQFKSDRSKIAMTNISSTRMACQNSKLESAFVDALNSADNYVINREVLLLRKSTTVIARFQSTIKK